MNKFYYIGINSNIVNALYYYYRSNISNYTFNLKADFDKSLVLDGIYNIQGKIIILPIRGEGKSNLTLGIYHNILNIKYSRISILNY